MRLLSKTNFFTVGIMEFPDQGAMYGVISVAPFGLPGTSALWDYFAAKCNFIPNGGGFITLLQNQYHKLQAQEADLLSAS